jgi:hypothetical protein
MPFRHGLEPADVLRFAHGRPSRETVALLAPDADPDAEAELIELGCGRRDPGRRLPNDPPRD